MQLINLIDAGKLIAFSTFDFSTLQTKLPHNKLLLVLRSLTGFCFDGGQNEDITVRSYGARWVKYLKDNRQCTKVCMSRQVQLWWTTDT